MELEQGAAVDMYFDNESSMVFGILLIVGALLCRYGAELSTHGDCQ